MQVLHLTLQIIVIVQIVISIIDKYQHLIVTKDQVTLIITMAVVIRIIKKTTIIAGEWGFDNKVKLNIESNNDIFKVGNRSFQFGHINYDKNFVNIFCYHNFICILDLGLKFVPSFYFNSFQLFLFFLINIDTELVNFNNKFTINTSREINNNRNKKSNLLSEIVLDEPENYCENELFSQKI